MLVGIIIFGFLLVGAIIGAAIGFFVGLSIAISNIHEKWKQDVNRLSLVLSVFLYSIGGSIYFAILSLPISGTIFTVLVIFIVIYKLSIDASFFESVVSFLKTVFSFR